MTHTYHIQGMTCTGCKASVEKTLQTVGGVQDVQVDLEKEIAIVTSSKHLSNATLQKALPSKFTVLRSANISATLKENICTNAEKNAVTSPSKWEQLKPLFLIFLCIILATTALNFNDFSFTEAMLDFMGLFFFVFSLFKFLDLSGFAASFAMYDPLAKIAPSYGRVYPFLEVSLGFLLLAQMLISVALIITLVVLSITTIGVTKVLLQKKQIQCACLGTVLKLPMTQATFIENSIMIFMAIFMLLKLYV